MLQNGGPIGNGAIIDKNDMGVQAAARLESHVIQITERVGVSCDNALFQFSEGDFSPCSRASNGQVITALQGSVPFLPFCTLMNGETLQAGTYLDN